MLFQASTSLALVLAHFCVPFNADIVDVGKMTFQSVTLLAFVLAYVARKPFNVDVVFVGKHSFSQVCNIHDLLKVSPSL